MLSASSAQTSCCWTSHLQHADSYMLLVSLSCDARTSHVRPSSRKYLQVQSSCRTKLTLELPPWKPPYLSCTTLLFWCSRSCLLSGRWQRAKEVIASLELAPCENTATAGAIDWRKAHSEAADAARVPLLPLLRPCRTFCSKRLRGIQLTKTLLSC